MRYPRAIDIKEYKDLLWTRLLQYFGGWVPIDSVEADLRALMGDAVLWMHREHKELDLEKMKRVLASIRVTDKWKKYKARHNRTCDMCRDKRDGADRMLNGCFESGEGES